VPEPVLGLALLAVVFVFVWATLVGRRRPSPPLDGSNDPGRPSPESDDTDRDDSPADHEISTSQGSAR